jgi:hypothetical protein
MASDIINKDDDYGELQTSGEHMFKAQFKILFHHVLGEID